MTREQVMRGLADLHAVACGLGGDQCYINGMGIKQLQAITQEATRLLGGDSTRCLSAEEFAACPCGTGWIEDWNDDGEFYIQPFAWAGGNTVCEDGTSTKGHMVEIYGTKYGIRVWVGDSKPTKEDQEAVKWNDCT